MADGAGGGGDAPLSKNAQKKLAAAKAREEAKAAKKSAREAAAKDTKSKKKEKGGAEKAEKKGADKASADKGGGEQFSFPKAEEEILSFWEDIKAFETSLKLSEGKKEFTFYDGPPFATGKPHYGKEREGDNGKRSSWRTWMCEGCVWTRDCPPAAHDD